MTILQTFKCDVTGCEATQTEPSEGAGLPGWGRLQGVVFHPGTPEEAANPILCDKHLRIVAEFVHGLRESVIMRVDPLRMSS